MTILSSDMRKKTGILKIMYLYAPSAKVLEVCEF